MKCNQRRCCGVLLNISSLPGPGGMGSLGGEARSFVDFLVRAGQSCWQVLPPTPPARGNSPYSSYSVFAGNPYLVSLEELVRQGLLAQHDLRKLPPNTGQVDFDWCANQHMTLLQNAYATWKQQRGDCADFVREQSFWLEDYALFMALKDELGDIPFQEWEEPLLLRDSATLAAARERLEEATGFWMFAQYQFYTQWAALKSYANKQGISLIGDIPIYVDVDSADVWANPQAFQVDETRNPQLVAGVPPDAFSADGQLWGNPLYNWNALEQDGYRWWMERLRLASGLYDRLRIDHFRALDEYFAIPAGSLTAKDGEWKPGPGLPFVRAAKKALRNCQLIAEDLGMLTDSVRDLLKKSGLPGMKVLLFAFDTGHESDYLPHNFIRNCVGYIGTHDNDTAVGWLESAPADQVRHAKRYLGLSAREGYHWGFVRGLYATAADTVIVQMQDLLGLDNSARMNIPGTPDGNWGWRLKDGQLEDSVARKAKGLSKLYFRI